MNATGRDFLIMTFLWTPCASADSGDSRVCVITCTRFSISKQVGLDSPSIHSMLIQCVCVFYSLVSLSPYSAWQRYLIAILFRPIHS